MTLKIFSKFLTFNQHSTRAAIDTAWLYLGPINLADSNGKWNGGRAPYFWFRPFRLEICLLPSADYI